MPETPPYAVLRVDVEIGHPDDAPVWGVHALHVLRSALGDLALLARGSGALGENPRRARPRSPFARPRDRLAFTNRLEPLLDAAIRAAALAQVADSVPVDGSGPPAVTALLLDVRRHGDDTATAAPWFVDEPLDESGDDAADNPWEFEGAGARATRLPTTGHQAITLADARTVVRHRPWPEDAQLGEPALLRYAVRETDTAFAYWNAYLEDVGPRWDENPGHQYLRDVAFCLARATAAIRCGLPANLQIEPD